MTILNHHLGEDDSTLEGKRDAREENVGDITHTSLLPWRRWAERSIHNAAFHTYKQQQPQQHMKAEVGRSQEEQEDASQRTTDIMIMLMRLREFADRESGDKLNLEFF